MRYRGRAGKLLLITFGLLQCIVLTSIYQFWIVSSLVQSKPALPFKDYFQFMREFRQGRYKLVSQYKGHWQVGKCISWEASICRCLRCLFFRFYEQLEHSMAFPFREMREITKRTKISWTHSIKDALKMVLFFRSF
jgi:hypothetical protein